MGRSRGETPTSKNDVLWNYKQRPTGRKQRGRGRKTRGDRSSARRLLTTRRGGRWSCWRGMTSMPIGGDNAETIPNIAPRSHAVLCTQFLDCVRILLIGGDLPKPICLLVISGRSGFLSTRGFPLCLFFFLICVSYSRFLRCIWYTFSFRLHRRRRLRRLGKGDWTSQPTRALVVASQLVYWREGVT